MCPDQSSDLPPLEDALMDKAPPGFNVPLPQLPQAPSFIRVFVFVCFYVLNPFLLLQAQFARKRQFKVLDSALGVDLDFPKHVDLCSSAKLG